MYSDRVVARFNEKWAENPDKGCWEWQAAKVPTGYGYFWAHGDMLRAHRVAWCIHNGEIPRELHVLHHCDNPGCVNPEHLFLGTQKDNMRDMKAKERAARGLRHWKSKIDEVAAIDIYTSNQSHTEIAKKHGISRTQVSDIRNKKAWTHIHPIRG